MKPIIDYIDFRQYMLDYYEDRKRRSAFSWREFSKITGFSSSSYMKVVCDGKSKLSRLGVEGCILHELDVQISRRAAANLNDDTRTICFFDILDMQNAIDKVEFAGDALAVIAKFGESRCI